MYIHIHIPKTAGSTFFDVMANAMDGAARSLPVEGNDLYDDAMMRRLVRENADMAFLASHGFTLPLPTVEGVTLDALVWLRDPVDRVYSAYRYTQRRAAQGVPKRFAHLPFIESFRASNRFHLERSGGRWAPFLNHQAYMLARDGDLEAARVRLREEVFFLGLIERFDESLLLLREALAARGLAAPVAYRSQNVGDRASAKEILSTAEYEEVLAANHLDAALYDEAQTILAERLACYPGDLAGDLRRLRRSCRLMRWRARARRLLRRDV